MQMYLRALFAGLVVLLCAGRVVDAQRETSRFRFVSFKIIASVPECAKVCADFEQDNEFDVCVHGCLYMTIADHLQPRSANLNRRDELLLEKTICRETCAFAADQWPFTVCTAGCHRRFLALNDPQLRRPVVDLDIAYTPESIALCAERSLLMLKFAVGRPTRPTATSQPDGITFTADKLILCGLLLCAASLGVILATLHIGKARRKVTADDGEPARPMRV